MAEVRFRANGVGKSILYLNEEGKWKSTGQKTVLEAREWYYVQKPKDELTFKVFATGFFTDESEGSYKYLQTMTGRHTRNEWWSFNNNNLKTYLMPFYGDTPLYKINTKMIQSWYLALKGVTKDEIKSQTKRKILDTLSIIMGHAVYSGLIDVNPCKAVIRMKKDNGNGREPYTNDELARMFPESEEELIKVWGSLMWAVYFMIMRDTGWRPGEISALTEEGYYEELNGIYTTRSVNSFDKVVQNSIKTTKKGYKYRIGILTEQTGKLLKKLIAERNGGLLFLTSRGQIVTNYAVRAIFADRMSILGVDTKDRPPYALRTTFMTNAAKRMNREQVEILMGHKEWRSCYDKRTAEDVLEQIIKSQSAN